MPHLATTKDEIVFEICVILSILICNKVTVLFMRKNETKMAEIPFSKRF
jgi:hypothetical protein